MPVGESRTEWYSTVYTESVTPVRGGTDAPAFIFHVKARWMLYYYAHSGMSFCVSYEKYCECLSRYFREHRGPFRSFFHSSPNRLHPPLILEVWAGGVEALFVEEMDVWGVIIVPGIILRILPAECLVAGVYA
ncbi:unnamed protein product [Sphacelaria rigidula]